MTNLPQPIMCTFTVKEAANAHILLSQLLAQARDRLHEPELHERFVAELERQLKGRGCWLSEEGEWCAPRT